MNAIQFIKEHGVEKAREVVEGAPDKTATHYVYRKIPNYYSVEFQSWYHDGEWRDSDCHTEQDLIDSYGSDFVLSLSDLKRLVESVERINSCGGLHGFKTYCNGDFSKEDLQAIADYKQIYRESNDLQTQ